MTRITNFGRKRTYLEAGLTTHLPDGATNQNTEPPTITDHSKTDQSENAAPPKKKRKRTKKSMRDGNTGVLAAKAEEERTEREAKAKLTQQEAVAAAGTSELPALVLSKSAKKKKREKDRKVKGMCSPFNPYSPNLNSCLYSGVCDGIPASKANR